jgi:hypothetical protein
VLGSTTDGCSSRVLQSLRFVPGAGNQSMTAYATEVLVRVRDGKRPPPLAACWRGCLLHFWRAARGLSVPELVQMTASTGRSAGRGETVKLGPAKHGTTVLCVMLGLEIVMVALCARLFYSDEATGEWSRIRGIHLYVFQMVPLCLLTIATASVLAFLRRVSVRMSVLTVLISLVLITPWGYGGISRFLGEGAWTLQKRFVSRQNETAEPLEIPRDAERRVVAHVACRMAENALRAGHAREAYGFMRQVIGEMEKTERPTPIMLEPLRVAASAAEASGEEQSAELFLKKRVTVAETCYGVRDPHTKESLEDLAQWYEGHGRRDDGNRTRKRLQDLRRE